jgi:hypothetical protein
MCAKRKSSHASSQALNHEVYYCRSRAPDRNITFTAVEAGSSGLPNSSIPQSLHTYAFHHQLGGVAVSPSSENRRVSCSDASKLRCPRCLPGVWTTWVNWIFGNMACVWVSTSCLRKMGFVLSLKMDGEVKTNQWPRKRHGAELGGLPNERAL